MPAKHLLVLLLLLAASCLLKYAIRALRRDKSLYALPAKTTYSAVEESVRQQRIVN